jgi:hypothetical protein
MPNIAPYRAGFSVPDRLRVDALSFAGESVTVYASGSDPAARCPLCAVLVPDPRPLHAHPGRPAVVRHPGAPAGPGT